MASTRSKNTPGNYKLEQNINSLSSDYDLYSHSQHGPAYRPSIPSIGFFPNGMAREALSTNPIEIESALFGINSTNLVDPKPNTIAHLKSLPKKDFFDRLPMIMPKNLVVEKNQRPLRS
jgi:hypothetical protein